MLGVATLGPDDGAHSTTATKTVLFSRKHKFFDHVTLHDITTPPLLFSDRMWDHKHSKQGRGDGDTSERRTQTDTHRHSAVFPPQSAATETQTHKLTRTQNDKRHKATVFSLATIRSDLALT